MSYISFVCPYCSKPTTVTQPNYFSTFQILYLDKPSNLGQVGLNMYSITCPNEECKNLFLEISLNPAKYVNGSIKQGAAINKWQLLPESKAKVLPEYIPLPIREDYYEACRIRDLSPKASATLSRRCLQGMIRDFWNIRKDRLKDEVDALKDKIDPIIWEGIDAVRSVGNIGAHMEKDINIIVDVDPDEAQLLIGLIENLVEDWYVARKAKQEHLSKLKALAKEKNEVRDAALS
jgi:hypothetical protein